MRSLSFLAFKSSWYKKLRLVCRNHPSLYNLMQNRPCTKVLSFFKTLVEYGHASRTHQHYEICVRVEVGAKKKSLHQLADKRYRRRSLGLAWQRQSVWNGERKRRRETFDRPLGECWVLWDVPPPARLCPAKSEMIMAFLKTSLASGWNTNCAASSPARVVCKRLLCLLV